MSVSQSRAGSFSRITEVAHGLLVSSLGGAVGGVQGVRLAIVNVMACALVASGRKRDYEQINRYASNVEPLLVDYFEHPFDRASGATDWREEVASTAIDKKSLKKGLQTRGVRAVTLVEYALRKKVCDQSKHKQILC